MRNVVRELSCSAYKYLVAVGKLNYNTCFIVNKVIIKRTRYGRLNGHQLRDHK